jgi:hypothetical protein
VSLVAADLDQTLIFSRNASLVDDTGGLVVVERYQGHEMAYVNPTAVATMSALVAHPGFVAVTSRSSEQVRRLELPGGTPARVLCANGARLLLDGVEDPGHRAVWDERLSAYPSGGALADSLRELLPGAASIRNADDAYAVARFDVAADAHAAEAGTRAWVRDAGCTATVSGRKLYVLPLPLTKGAGLALLDEPVLAAAGDSVLDVSMLDLAADARVPLGSELDRHPAGAPYPKTTGRGIAAGEEIAGWLTRCLADGPIGAS